MVFSLKHKREKEREREREREIERNQGNCQLACHIMDPARRQRTPAGALSFTDAFVIIRYTVAEGGCGRQAQPQTDLLQLVVLP